MIKCYINKLEKCSIIEYENNLFLKDLSDLKFYEEIDLHDEFANILKIITKLSIEIKKELNAQDTETVLIVNNIDFFNFMKPEGKLIREISKSYKKSLTNNNLKLNLGNALYELSKIKNLDIQYLEKFPSLDTKSLIEFNRNELEKIKKTTLDLQVDSEFNLGVDFSPLNAIIEISNIDEIYDNSLSLFDNTPTNSDTINTNFNSNDFKTNNNQKTNPKRNLKNNITEETKELKILFEKKIELLNADIKKLEDLHDNLNIELDDIYEEEEIQIERFKEILDIRFKLKTNKALLEIYNKLFIELKDLINKF